jgi:hypothetical protein
VTVFILSGCQQHANSATGDDAKTATNLDQYIGWFHGNCLAIKNKEIKNGEKVKLIFLGESQELHEAEIKGAALSSETCPALSSGRKEANMAEGYSFYEIIPKQTQTNIMGIGIVGLSSEYYRRVTGWSSIMLPAFVNYPMNSAFLQYAVRKKIRSLLPFASAGVSKKPWRCGE